MRPITNMTPDQLRAKMREYLKADDLPAFHDCVLILLSQQPDYSDEFVEEMAGHLTRIEGGVAPIGGGDCREVRS